MQFKSALIIFVVLVSFNKNYSQQQPDTTFTFQIEKPLFSSKHPVIGIDQMHNNLHTKGGGFAPFAKLAEMDGFKVIEFSSYDQLENIDVLIIANPIHPKNQGNWTKPTYSAFEDEEIQRIKEWVYNGGSLLLIADHMPFAGAANKLANTFGFNYCDGFAQLSERQNNQDVFSIDNNRLNLEGLSDDKLALESITTFTGSAFTYPEKASVVLRFLENDRCLIPETAWQFNKETETTTLKGFAQGAIMPTGHGKIAIFGEAAMFTAQTFTQNGNIFTVGFNSPLAKNNILFIRSLLDWITEDKQLRNSSEEQFEDSILKTMEKMEQTFNQGNFREVAAFYTKDAQVIGHQTAIKGTAELRDYWSRFSGNLKWKLESTDLTRLGENFALQNGYSNIYYIGKDGEKKNSRSFFSLIWEKTDNEWKIKLDHYSPRSE